MAIQGAFKSDHVPNNHYSHTFVAELPHPLKKYLLYCIINAPTYQKKKKKKRDSLNHPQIPRPHFHPHLSMAGGLGVTRSIGIIQVYTHHTVSSFIFFKVTSVGLEKKSSLSAYNRLFKCAICVAPCNFVEQSTLLLYVYPRNEEKKKVSEKSNT